MGYACPVCGVPQTDGEHLANHLAFVAVLHGGEHESWLDGHVPDWADRDPGELAAEVVDRAEEVDHGTVFDEATGGRPEFAGRRPDAGQTDGRQRGEGGGSRPERGRNLDPEVRRIVEEAVEMTRRRAGDDRDRGDGETGE